MKNLTKLPMGFTLVKAFVAVSLSLTQLAFANNSTGSGNRGTGEPVHNKKKNNGEESNRTSQDKLNFNEVKVSSNRKMSDELKSQHYFVINLNELLGVYSFPNDQGLLDDLYKKALQKEGDYTSLQGYQNPFSEFMSQEIVGDFIDSSKAWKKFPSKYVRIISSSYYYHNPYQFVLSRKIFSDLPSGLKLKGTMQINPQLSTDGCAACSPADYKPIAKDGISLNVICEVTSIKGDGSSLYEYNDKEPLRYVTGVTTYITSPTEKIDIEAPVINSAIAEEIRVKYCHNQNINAVKVAIYCGLVPSTNSDEAKLLSSFRLDHIGIGYFGFTLKNFKNLDRSSESMARDINPKFPLSRVKGDKLVGRFPILGIDGDYEIVAYKFPEFSDDVTYANSEAELADMVRRSYILGYEALQKKNQGN